MLLNKEEGVELDLSENFEAYLQHRYNQSIRQGYIDKILHLIDPDIAIKKKESPRKPDEEFTLEIMKQESD